jgi:hypothetical protein
MSKGKTLEQVNQWREVRTLALLAPCLLPREWIRRLAMLAIAECRPEDSP